MSLSNHFKKSPVPADANDLSWLSAASFTPVVPGIDKADRPETRQPVEPNELLPSKAISSYMKNVRFNAYKSTRPALLEEVTTLVETQLRDLNRKFEGKIPKDVELHVYSAAFERFIAESTLYKPFLTNVKDHYDKYIMECTTRSAQFDELDIMLEAQQNQHNQRLENVMNDLNDQRRELEAQLRSVQVTLKDTAATNAKLVLENSRLQESNGLYKKEIEAVRNSNGLLSAQLARLAEEKLRSESVEAQHIQELSHLKQIEMSLNADLERLRELLAQKEAEHAVLISPEVFAGVQAQLETTREENARITGTHRQLLMRYSAVKFMIDGSFKRIDDAKQMELEAPHIGRAKTESKIMEVLKDYNTVMQSARKKEALKLKAPTEKVLELVQESAYPKVIFECLLDQIERLQLEKRRLLYGDEDPDRDDAQVNEDGEVEEELPADAVFEGLGFGDDVPSYLRYEGTIRNLRISRRTTVDLVHELCAAKAAHEALGIAPASIILPASPSAGVGAPGSPDCGRQDGRDSDSDLESVGSRSHRPRSSSMLRSPPRSPQSPHTQALFSSMRPLSSHQPHGHHHHSSNEDAEGAGARSLTSIDSTTEVFVPSLPSLPSTCTMAEFFECFLKDKVRDPVAAVELAYNIVDALRRHAPQHSDCRAFQEMLAGNMLLAVWMDRCAVVEKLRSAALKENANSRATDGEWKLTPEKFMKVVKKVLSTASEDDLAALKELVQAEQSANSRYVDGTALLYDSEDGSPSPFLELVKAQHLLDCQTMTKSVVASIEQVCGELGVDEVPIGKLREAIVLADSNKTRLEVNLLLARGASCSLEEILLREAKRVPIPLAAFKANVVNGLLKKSPPQAAKKAKK